MPSLLRIPWISRGWTLAHMMHFFGLGGVYTWSENAVHDLASQMAIWVT